MVICRILQQIAKAGSSRMESRFVAGLVLVNELKLYSYFYPVHCRSGFQPTDQGVMTCLGNINSSFLPVDVNC